MKRMIALAVVGLMTLSAVAQEKWLSFQGKDGPGKGKRIVLIPGDEEYRSEESMPMLAKIFSHRHGFDTTVLFSWSEDGTLSIPFIPASLVSGMGKTPRSGWIVNLLPPTLLLVNVPSLPCLRALRSGPFSR